jgi:hypothetical protein
LALAAHPQLRLLIAAQMAVIVAGGMAMISLPWFVLASGGGPVAASFSFLVTYVPYLLLGVPAGAIGDRLDRRLTMILAGGLGTVCAGALAAAALHGSVPLVVVLVAGFGLSTVRPLADAAFFSCLAGHDDDGFISVGTFMSSANVAGRIIGPLAAGTLIVLFGSPVALSLIAVLFASSVMAAACAPDIVRVVPAPESMMTGVRAAAAYLAGPARVILVSNTLWNLLTGGAGLVLVAPFVASLGGNAAAGSAVVVAGNLAALAAAAAMPSAISRFGTRAVLTAAFPLTGLGLLAFAGSGSPLGALCLYALLYVANQGWVSAVLVAAQADAPVAVRASTASLSRVCAFGGIVVGGSIAGLAAGSFGVRATIAGSGVAVLAIGLALAAWRLSQPSNLPSEQAFAVRRVRELLDEVTP